MSKYDFNRRLNKESKIKLKSLTKQFQSATHSANAGKHLKLSTYHCFYFNLYVLNLFCEWAPPQIFFCGYRVLQLFCHDGEGAHDTNCSLKWLKCC